MKGFVQPPLPLDHFGERWIRTPGDHGRAIHGGGKGVVALVQVMPSGYWRERVYPVEVALDVLRFYEGRENVYLAMQRFRRRRRIVSLLSLSSLWVDLDYYRAGYAGWHPYAVLELALERVTAACYPPPTIAIGSGRGLYLVWQHEPVPRAALPRWSACQREIWEELREFGADRRSIDAARVLRVTGSLNPRALDAGDSVASLGRVEALLPVGDAYGFDELAGRILPFSREEIAERGARRARVREERRRKREEAGVWAPPTHLEGFGWKTMWEARLDALQQWRFLRYGDGPMLDHRHRWLYWTGVAMSWLAQDPHQMRRELYALAAEAGGWTETRAAGDLGSVVRRTYDAFAERKIEHAGRLVDPRYRARNETIIDDLGITEEEQRLLPALWGDEVRREKERDRGRRRRREAGSMTLVEYRGRAQDRRAEARVMAEQGWRNSEIAAALKITPRRVSQYLKDVPAKAKPKPGV